jgi:hypothetical protein
MNNHIEAYHLSQSALADLKSAILAVLSANDGPMKNADLGRLLGLYHGHIGHQGHITRTLLELMKSDGVVHQSEDTKEWSVNSYPNSENE